MDDGDIDGGGEDELRLQPQGLLIGGAKKYIKVASNERLVQMSNFVPGASSSATPSNINVNSNHGMTSEASTLSSQLQLLFGIDPLLNISDLSRLCSMAGMKDQTPVPQNGEDVSNTPKRTKITQVKLGTWIGVFIPCLQSILGIIYFIRFSWIVGMAGIGDSFLIVAFCCLCNFLTALSLSAIATNGAMQRGGPYYLISRALGQEVGVSIGLCFFLGTAVAGALYILGAVETVLHGLPGAGIFTETISQVNGTAISPIQRPSNYDLQMYGIVVTIILCCIVFGGVNMINRVAPVFLIPVLVSVVCIYIGIFASGNDNPAKGITGMSLETFKENWTPNYQTTNNAGIPEPNGSLHWNFNALVGLFFPAVTGIMSGSNQSSTLKDTQQSIPVGTLAATIATSSLYLVSVFIFGAFATREKLLTDRLLTATVAWPFPQIVYVGIVLSTLGAALQSLSGAPHLLAAIAYDEILPILNCFNVGEDSDQPRVATLFTAFICIGCVLIGNLDLISPAITMCYLLCYAGVNLSCFLLDFLDAPSWRPRWKLHHWSLSLLGAFICIVIMIFISPSFTLVSLALAGLIYKYVSIKGTVNNWGDGFKSAYFQLSLRSLRTLGGLLLLLQLSSDMIHLLLNDVYTYIFSKSSSSKELVPDSSCRMPEEVPCHPKLADFANCMKKKGRGMSIFLSILVGDYPELPKNDLIEKRSQLRTYIEENNCEGVAEIIVSSDISSGFRVVVQTMGLGNLKPNIIVMQYPENWWEKNSATLSTFVGVINDCVAANKGVVIVKGLDSWPQENQAMDGGIDLYWIVEDGGLMFLLSHLLLTKRRFESCKIRVFCIAEAGPNADKMKDYVKKFIYDLRMQAEVTMITEGWRVKDESYEAFGTARGQIPEYVSKMKKTAGRDPVEVDEQQVEKFLYTALKLNSTILSNLKPKPLEPAPVPEVAVVLVSLPQPPKAHPAHSYLEYLELLAEKVPRLLLVRGSGERVVTWDG